MDLSGVWRVTPADDDLRRDAIGAAADDTGWASATVPGHWRHHPDFADHDGPMLYRRSFAMEPPAPGRRRWITFDGLFYQADVWLDGAYLGDPEGYFVPTAFDVTSLMTLGDQHALAVEVACPPQPELSAKRTITGVYQAWHGIDREWNPGGIPAPVRVVDTGPVRIDRFRVLCRDADPERAHLLMTARLDAETARRIRLRTSVDGRRVSETEHALAAGNNEVAWNLDIDEPALWWPRALGAQPLTEISVDVLVDGQPSDVAVRRTGLREVAWNRWICSINGERLFLKGANLLPTRLTPADVTDDDVRRDLALAADAGLDAVRVHGHLAPRALYEAADETGILVLQDFPLVGGYARSVRPQAVEQARAAVDLLGHHPSIVSWSAHDDPGGADDTTDRPGRLRRLVTEQLPSWNRTVLDRWVKRSFERADPTRPCIPQSGALPHLPQLDGTDSHLSFGWGHGDVRDLERVAHRVPRVVRFVSEFGAQAIPDDAGFVDTSDWPDLEWEQLERHHGAQRQPLEERSPTHAFASFEEWRTATQRYQAELIRHHVETLRRLKYRPTGGFCLYALNDPAPLISFAVLDHHRTPKLGYDALRRACDPVVVIADRPPDEVPPGRRIRLDVHVVSDLRHQLVDAEVDVRASWPGGTQHWRFAGDIPADSCVKVGQVILDAPPTPGTIEIHIQMRAGDITAVNRYATRVVDPAEPLPARSG